MGPTRRDVLTLVGLQIACGALMTLISRIAGMDGGGLAGVGVMLGALAFVQMKQQKEPGRFVGPYTHRLALWAAAAQLLIGLPFVVAWVVTEDWGSSSALLKVAFVAVVTLAGGGLGYGVTRLGFRIGLPIATKARPGAPQK
jgi:hypothetical protein